MQVLLWQNLERSGASQCRFLTVEIKDRIRHALEVAVVFLLSTQIDLQIRCV